MHLNIEIKARCPDPAQIHAKLRALRADFRGIDHQIDTYFQLPSGRLKLREGTIERSLIFYERPDQTGPKPSHVRLYQVGTNSADLRALLTDALGILQIVDKQRAIYFVDNVKFHVDEVQQLGSFVEIEAIDQDGSLGADHLRQQCDHYLDYLEITSDQLIDRSYSDML